MHAHDDASVHDDGSVTSVTTVRDTGDAFRLHNLVRFWSWQTLAAIALRLPVAAVVFASLHLGWRWTAAAVVACAASGAAPSRGMVQCYVPLVARRTHRQQLHLHDELRASQDANGLRIVTPHGDSRTPWNHYRCWREDARVVLLYQSDALFQFISKRVLGTKEVASLRVHAAAAGVRRAQGRLA